MKTADPLTRFAGAKLMLFLGAEILILERDHSPGIPWPGRYDFPGGGREGFETPQACVLRETHEETGLWIDPSDLRLVHLRGRAPRAHWFFAAHLPAESVAEVRFGNEGEGWHMMAPSMVAAHPRIIPHFGAILGAYLERLA